MRKTYSFAPQPVRDLVNSLIASDQHVRLAKAEVKIGLIMVHPELDEKTGMVKAPAIKGHAGASAAACVKPVPLKDRLTKGFDVIRRHGKAALEFQALKTLVDHDGQLLLELVKEKE
jgi:hypothetical protein